MADPTTKDEQATQDRQELGTLLDDMAGWGGAPAIVEHRGVRGFTTGYGELAELARRFAAELARRSVAPGERVVLWGGNGAAWVAAYFGCVRQGVLPVPLDATGSAELARRIVDEVSPRLIVGDRALLTQGGFAPPQLQLDTLRDRLPEPEPGPASEPSRPALGPDSPLQILFTSGTTGTPKGVVHTHRNLLSSLLPIEHEIAKYRRYERLVHPLRFLHTLPLSHVFGQFMGLWVPPLLGAVVHYEDRTTGARLAALIPEERINVLAAVPRTLELLRAQLLANFPGLEAEISAAQGLSISKRWWRFRRIHRALGLRFWAAVCGGATLAASVEHFWTTLGFALVQGYGLTETAALVTLNHPFKTTRGSLGAPLPGRSLRVSESGELEVKGEMVSTASWQNGAMVQRDDPWLATGDLAAIGEDGRVSFLGRSGQRLVTAAGLNVYLQDVEAALAGQQEIAEAVVLPLAGTGGSEEPGAVLLARGGSAAAAAAVARANATLAAHQQVRRWWLWPELALPRTGSGKMARKKVETWAREQAAAAEQPQPGQQTGQQADPLQALLLSIGARSASLEDSARLDEDWGLDSMGRVALAAALEEQAGVALGDGTASQLQTLGDVRALLRGSLGGQAEATVAPPSAPAVGEHPQALVPGNAMPVQSISVQPLAPVRRGQPPAAALYRYPRWPWAWPVAALRMVFVETVLRPLVWLLASPRIHRPRTQRPLSAPLLLISNHRTAMDVPLLLFALPGPLRRRVAVAMSGEMLAAWERSWSPRPLPLALREHRRWWGPVAAFLLKALLNVFPLPRTSGFRSSFAHAGKALNRGYSVMIFPEGRRSHEGELLPFKGGLGILAQEAFVPVLPMALGIPLHTQKRWLRSRPVIAVGPLVDVSDAEDAEARAETLRSAVAALLKTE